MPRKKQPYTPRDEHGSPAFGPGAHPRTAGDFRPSREELLAFIEENPDRSGKRDLARAFSLKGADRIWLKDTLTDLHDEGLVEKDKKRLKPPGTLPHVAVLDIFSRDADGTLLARPAERDASDTPIVVAIKTAKAGRGPAPGVGDRVLAKTFRNEDRSGPAYTARIMKVFEKRANTALGVFRAVAGGSFRVVPVERGKPEFEVPDEFRNGAREGDLVEVETGRSTRYGLPQAKIVSVLGSLASEKAVSMIAIHAHGIPHIFPREVLAEAEDAKPAALQGREDWRSLTLVTIDPADAKDHDDAVHATPDTDPANPGGVIATVAIADVAAYMPLRLGARPGGAEPRQFGLFPGSRRTHAAGAHLQ